MICVSNNLISNPLVSVFIFTYNQEGLIGKTIDSILHQKCSYPFEIILVDDCSVDNTFDVCFSFWKKNPDKIHLVKNDANKGIKRNFFESLSEYVRGKYIAICGGDDWWIDPLKLEKQVSFLIANTDFSLVHTRAKVFIQKENKYSGKLIGTDRNSYNLMVVSNGIAALTTCFTRESFLDFVKEMDPINQQLPMDDYGMWIWHAFRRKIHFMEDVTCVYRVLPESLSNTVSFPKKHFIEKERRLIKMFFINYFSTYEPQLIKLINLRCFLDTLQTTDLVGDSSLRIERNKFFLQNHYYVFYLIALVYQIIGTNLFWNRKVYFVERVAKRLHYTRKYFV